MNWGNSLLAELIDTSPIEEWFAGVLYHIGAFVWGIFYIIWMWLAKLVNIIEKIFKNLAGIGESSSDMVSTIIESEAIRDIFQNLVALSMALIVFFTIIKIIQDHYKDTKSGGNPYQTVLRTFKGLLMFFFVTTAVSVGLYASGVMFRALDAATGSESSSVSGQIFKAMAAEANRKRIGPAQSGLTKAEKNKYYSRLTNTADNSNGRYFITVVSGDTSLSSQALKEAYYKAFPALQYGVVNEDGSVTPVVRWLGTQARSLDIQDVDELIDRMKGNLADDNGFSDDYSSGSFGYSNDFLTGLSINIQPSISLTWSPLDIQTFSYRLYEYGTPEPDEINTSFFGNGITVKHGFRKFKFFSTGDKVQKDMSEAAKVLGFTFNAGIGFQDKGVTSYYDLNTYNIEKFVPILQSVLGNIGYTGALEWLLQNIPAFYGAYYFGKAFEINWISMLGNAIRIVIECLADEPFTVKDEEGNVICTPISFNPASFNTGVWSTVNLGSPNLDVSIEQYRVDHNFTELWSSIKDSLKDVVNQFDGDVQSRYEQMSEEAASAINSVSSLMQKQADMLAYKGYVDTYNSEALENLTNLGNCLQLYDNVKAMDEDQRNSYFNRDDVNYKGTFASLKSDIRSTWCNLVKNYNEKIKGKLPTSYYADPRVSYSIYKPIIEFAISDYQASSGDFASDDGNGVPADSAIDAIKKAMVNDQGTGKVSVNMLIDDVTDSSVYRMVDWGVYGPAYGGTISVSELKNYADIYASKDYINGLTADAKNKKVFNNESVNDLRFGSIAANTTGTWNDLGGIRYFIGLGSNKNDFKSHSVANGVRATLKENGYWALDGIHVDNDQWNVMYVGKRIEGVFPNNLVSDQNLAYNGTNSMRTSSAKINASRTEYAESELHKSLTAKADKDLLNDFKNNIITFRKLDTAAGSQQQDADKAVLKDWMQTAFIPGVHPGVSHKEIDLTDEGNDAAYIDDLMAAGSDSTRRYLMLTKECETDFSNTNNWGEYIGRVSWDEYKTVKALYELDEIHYVMGFIGIITAVGVYMNFTFGLIQRAINMSVLYIMSPITIAFYPFDDGQRFKSSFVTPFYKEAISAYAVIVSLNLFFVLMNPLTRAAEQAVGGGVSGYFIGWLALVAFVSMLPKIRDSICSILGAGSMSSQSLTDTFKNAYKNVTAPIKELNNARKSATKALAHASNEALKKSRFIKWGGEAIGNKLADFSEERLAKGKDNMFDHYILRKYRKGSIEKRDRESQEKIDRVLNARKILSDSSASVEDKKAASDTLKNVNLSNMEQKRLKRQERAMRLEADRRVLQLNPDKQLTKDEYNEKFNEQYNALMKDSSFKKKRNYTMVQKMGYGAIKTADFANKLVSAPVKLPELIGTGIKKTSSAIKNVDQKYFAGTLGLWKNTSALGVGLTNTINELKKNKDSLAGALFNAADPSKIDEEVQKTLGERGFDMKKVMEQMVSANAKRQEGMQIVSHTAAEASAFKTARAAIENANESDGDKLVYSRVADLKYELINDPNYKDLGDKKVEELATTKMKAKLMQECDPNEYNKAIYITKQKEWLKQQDEWKNKSDAEINAEAVRAYNGNMAYDPSGAELKKNIEKFAKNENKTIDDYYTELAEQMDANGFAQFKTKHSKLLGELYHQEGGDAKLAENMAAGKKEYQGLFGFDTESENTKKDIGNAKNDFMADLKEGSSKISDKLEDLKKTREDSLKGFVDSFSGGDGLNLKIGSKERKTLEDIIRKVGRSDTFDDIVDKVARGVHKNNDEVKQVLSKDWALFAKNVQFNDDIYDWQLKLDAVKAYEQGNKDFNNKLGPHVPIEVKDELWRVYWNAHDGDFNSDNPESVGYLKNQIKQKYNGIETEECRKEMDAVQKRLDAEYDAMFEKVARTYGNEIKNHDREEKFKQEMRDIKASEIVPELQKEINLNASVNLSVDAMNLINKDNMLQELKRQGNYVLAGETVQLAVDAILKHDNKALEKLQLDENTKEELKKWEQEGGKRLQELKGLGLYHEFITTHFGAMSADMGGYSMSGVGSVLRNLYALTEQKTWVEKMEATVNSWADEESHNRAVVNSMRNKIDTMFAGAETWGNLWKDFNATTSEEFTAAINATLDAVDKGKITADIENKLQLLQNCRDEFAKNHDVTHAGIIDDFFNAVSAGKTGNMLADQVQKCRAAMKLTNANIVDILNKIKDFQVLMGSKK